MMTPRRTLMNVRSFQQAGKIFSMKMAKPAVQEFQSLCSEIEWEVSIPLNKRMTADT